MLVIRGAYIWGADIWKDLYFGFYSIQIYIIAKADFYVCIYMHPIGYTSLIFSKTNDHLYFLFCIYGFLHNSNYSRE